jgi:hypothetical protein
MVRRLPMKRAVSLPAFLAALGLLVMPIAATAAGTAGTWNGWITDEACGPKGANSAHKDCAVKCREKGSKLALYNTADKKLYKLDKQDVARQHLGHEVTVLGTADGDAISVESISPVGNSLLETPDFPWPPPGYSSSVILPQKLVTTGDREKLGLAFDRLTNALRQAGIADWTTYAVGPDGFAVVARLECIDDNGRAKSGSARWCIDNDGQVRTSRAPSVGSSTSAPLQFVSSYLARLFEASPGRYRVLVFVVSGRTIYRGPDAEPRLMLHLARSGAADLPQAIRDVIPLYNQHCEVLIYEFFRQAEDDAPTLVGSSVNAMEHLVGAGLWSRSKLGE